VRKAIDYVGEWEIPVFDFDHMDDPFDRDGYIGKPVTDECFREAFELIKSGDFHLPFPECLFIYKFKETAVSYDTFNVVIASETDGEITGNLFSKSFTGREPTNLWRWEPIQFTLVPGGEVLLQVTPDDVRLSPYWQSEYEMDARARYTNIMVSLLLLRRKAAVIEIETSSKRAQEIAAPYVPLHADPPPIRRILFNRLEIRRIGDAAEGRHHASPRPHIRRGHYRTLQSGRIVPVRSANVRGGSDTAPVYEAVSDTASPTK
jgi:hypothetical protein